MKKKIFFAIALIAAAVIAAVSPILSKDYVIHHLKWGMTVEEVSKAEGARGFDENTYELRSHAEKFLGSDCSITYKFNYDKQLEGVMIDFYGSKTNEELLKKFLTLKYGTPMDFDFDDFDYFSMLSCSLWVTKNSEVLLSDDCLYIRSSDSGCFDGMNLHLSFIKDFLNP